MVLLIIDMYAVMLINQEIYMPYDVISKHSVFSPSRTLGLNIYLKEENGCGIMHTITLPDRPYIQTNWCKLEEVLVWTRHKVLLFGILIIPATDNYSINLYWKCWPLKYTINFTSSIIVKWLFKIWRLLTVKQLVQETHLKQDKWSWEQCCLFCQLYITFYNHQRHF